MADQKISEMTTATALNDADFIPIVQSGVNKKAPKSLFGLGTVGPHSGGSWDGAPAYRLLNANLTLTLATSKRSGFMIFKQDATGGRTLTINGDSVPVASAANAFTIVSFTYNDQTSDYILEYSTNVIGNISGGDVTPPEVIGMVATDGTHISVSFDESVVAPDISGWSFKLNGANNPIVGATSPTSTVWTFEVTNTMISTDTILGSYNSGTGATEDTTGNELVSFTDQPVTNSISGSPEAETTAFVTAVEGGGDTLSPTQENALNNLVIALKAIGWSKFKAIYPIVGGTASAHKWNLKDPQDTDAAFRLEYTGTITHASTGMAGDGSTGFANTNFIPSTHSVADSASFGIYIRTNAATDDFAFGGNDGSGGMLLYPRLVAGNMRGRCNGGDIDDSAVANSTGFMGASRSNAPLTKQFKGGTSLGSNANPEYRTAQPVYLCGLNHNGSLTDPSTYEIAFFCIGDYLTDGEMASLNTAVVAYQTALSRNV